MGDRSLKTSLSDIGIAGQGYIGLQKRILSGKYVNFSDVSPFEYFYHALLIASMTNILLQQFSKI